MLTPVIAQRGLDELGFIGREFYGEELIGFEGKFLEEALKKSIDGEDRHVVEVCECLRDADTRIFKRRFGWRFFPVFNEIVGVVPVFLFEIERNFAEQFV